MTTSPRPSPLGEGEISLSKKKRGLNVMSFFNKKYTILLVVLVVATVLIRVISLMHG